jgi:hypothetical protein
MPEVDEGPLPMPTPPAAPAAIEERERTVLSELAWDVDAWVTFQGLRRQLGVHQQALVRTLRRLEASGLVAHAGKGYQLTDAGFSMVRVERPGAASLPVVPILHALLPPHVSVGDVAAHLSRRWFGGLRWYGRSESSGETTLHWIAERGRVTVRISAGSVTLEVEDAPSSDAKSFAAARPVLAALAELYGTGNGLVESSSRSAA